MNNKRLKSLTIYWIVAAVTVLCVLSFAFNESGTNPQAEQHFQKANELQILADYDAAITEYQAVINLSPNSKIAQNAQYWIGQIYLESGQFDAALSAFQKLIDEYPESTIVPSAKIMIERVQQVKNNQLLFEAATKGDIEQVKKLIAAGADVNAADNQSQSPLHFAARYGHEEIARLLIAEGADVNAGMADSWTPLLDAANGGYSKIVKLLLENGAKIDSGDVYGYTPLFYAIWSEDEETIRTLISAGADINKRPAENDCPALFYALWEGNQKAVKILIDAGADVNARDVTGWTPLHHLIEEYDISMIKLFLGKGIDLPDLQKAAFEGDLDKVRQLVEGGTDVNARDELGWYPSFWALSAGQKEVFEYLLNNGADITVKTYTSRTLLHQASKVGLTEIVEQLIAKGADVNVKDIPGRTPLQLAASQGHLDTVKLLVAKGANVDATSKNGEHAMGNAALAGHEEIVKFLIDSGAEVNLNVEGMGTALHAAVYHGDSKIVDLLIDNGADVNINARNGTPLHFVTRSPRLNDETCAQIVEKLLAKGANVNLKGTPNRDTPLHRAASSGRYKTAELLIAAGADVNAKDKDGHTPLWYAKGKYTMSENNTKIVELLRRHGAAESLHDAAEAGDISLVKKMISNGADVNSRSEGGLITPLYEAAHNGQKQVCQLLITKGAKVNLKSGDINVGGMNDNGWSPLHIACLIGSRDVVRLLLDNGAAINDKSRYNLTPLDLAIKRRHKEVVKLLLKYGAREGTPLQDRFKNARLIPAGKWLEGSFQYRHDEEWFTINVEQNKSYLIYFDDEFGTGKYSADIETYLYKQIFDDLESKHCLYTARHNAYQVPIKFTSDYNGKLYLRLISDNPQNSTFAIKYETEE